LSDHEFKAGARWLRSTGERLDPAKRQSAINLKRYLMARGAYPNGVTSIDVYGAVLDQGVGPQTFASWYRQYLLQRRPPDTTDRPQLRR
jgi:hypothetical protein